MIFKFVLICFLLRSRVRGEDGFQRSLREIDGAHYCDFDGSRRNYETSDLLQCIDALAADLIDRESGAKSGKSQWNGSTSRQISFADVFANLFDEDQSPHRTSLPADTTSGYYQSNYPTISGGTFDHSPGFQLNLFDALSSISRHDDYKCVPRILCEMASGKLPGRSLGKQTSSLLEYFGKNALTEWLATVDVAGSSPLLNFGRAMILGYSNRGNSLACYRAFPKCPRNADELVYYLNNHNGGFFRLFNKLQFGKQRRFGGLHGDYSRTRTQERIITGSTIEASHPEGVGNKVHFPRYEQFRSGNEVAFPNGKVTDNDPAANSIVNFPQRPETNNVAFFPQGADNKRYFRVRFP
ncbi:uncharacterized protein LOC143151074 isoform X2 [Ptiloglossa arizonensis]|uniref:uncharacterized protein LOC143151074 isoform X2 n=1 Tax=Ptiloglossa arizonensis TaxID=3350558 RepID=UPI003F9F5333